MTAEHGVLSDCAQAWLWQSVQDLYTFVLKPNGGKGYDTLCQLVHLHATEVARHHALATESFQVIAGSLTLHS
jgi:hypothetical protein